MKKNMKKYFFMVGLLTASVFSFVSCSGGEVSPVDNTIRLELNSSNYDDFNNEEIMSQYIGKEIYIHVDETVTSTIFNDVFFNGKYKDFCKSLDNENSKYDYIYATLDLSDATQDYSYVCGNVKKLILSKNTYYIDVFNARILEEIVIPEDNTHLTVIDGIMYDKDVKKIEGFPRATKLKKYVIPSTITDLTSSDINQPTTTSTKEVVVHENFKTFRSSSFFRFKGLESVVLKCTEPPVMGFDTSRNFAAFKECSGDIKFYVPKGCKDAYVQAWEQWYTCTEYDGDLADRIVESD